jgi:hypothetical protein
MIVDLMCLRSFKVLSSKEYKGYQKRPFPPKNLGPSPLKSDEEIKSYLEGQKLNIKEGYKGSLAQLGLFNTKRSSMKRAYREYAKLPQSIRYTRGQPMGAYASFALLAIVHHALVRYAAFRLGLTPQEWVYRVLGDDSVIFQTEESLASGSIADEYLRVCEEFGIPISVPKSYRSNNFYVFASRYSFMGIEVTPASMKPELQVNSTAKRVTFALDLWKKGWMVDGSRSSNQKWLSQLVRLLLQPMEHFVYTKRLHSNELGNITSRLIGLILLPRTSLSEVLGIQTDLKAWLASVTGSTEVIVDQRLITSGQFRGLTIMEGYERILSIVTRFLWKRVQSDVITSILINHENLDYLRACKAKIGPVQSPKSMLLGLRLPSFEMDIWEITIEELARRFRVSPSYFIKNLPSATHEKLLSFDSIALTTAQYEALEPLDSLPKGESEFLSTSVRGIFSMSGEWMTRYNRKWVTVAEFYENIILILLQLYMDYPMPTLIEKQFDRELVQPSRLFLLEQGRLDQLNSLANSIVLSLHRTPQ